MICVVTCQIGTSYVYNSYVPTSSAAEASNATFDIWRGK